VLPVLTYSKFLQVIFFFYCSYSLALQLSREYSIWVSHSSVGLGSLGSFSVFSGVLVAEEADGAGDKGSGDSTAVDVQSLLEAF
jgi:hypothetical protein